MQVLARLALEENNCDNSYETYFMAATDRGSFAALPIFLSMRRHSFLFMTTSMQIGDFIV